MTSLLPAAVVLPIFFFLSHTFSAVCLSLLCVCDGTCAAGRRDWFAFGYPAYDTRFGPTCKRDFLGRRWSWGVNAPVLKQPSSTSGSELYGNACGGLSGGPVLDWRRKALTSVVSRTWATCDAQGWGKIITAVILALPGGAPGLTNSMAGVDVYTLWKDF
jgi:hypothetical protein